MENQFINERKNCDSTLLCLNLSSSNPTAYFLKESGMVLHRVLNSEVRATRSWYTIPWAWRKPCGHDNVYAPPHQCHAIQRRRWLRANNLACEQPCERRLSSFFMFSHLLLLLSVMFFFSFLKSSGIFFVLLSIIFLCLSHIALSPPFLPQTHPHFAFPHACYTRLYMAMLWFSLSNTAFPPDFPPVVLT